LLAQFFLEPFQPKLFKLLKLECWPNGTLLFFSLARPPVGCVTTSSSPLEQAKGLVAQEINGVQVEPAK
jgi:hypothetical protein